MSLIPALTAHYFGRFKNWATGSRTGRPVPETGQETPGLVPCSQSRPADILLPNWSCGRPVALDVHVISPLQQQIIAEASHRPGHAL